MCTVENYHDMGYVVENIDSTNARIIGDNQFYVATGCGLSFLCYENDDYAYPLDIACEYTTSIKNIYTEKKLYFTLIPPMDI